MRKMLWAAAAFAIAGSAMTAQAGDARDARIAPPVKLANAERAGDVKDCIATRQIRKMRFLDEERVMVELSGGRKYLSQTSGRCDGVTKPNHHFTYTMPTTQLCRGEIIRVYESTGDMLTGSCALGGFQQMQGDTEA